MRPNKHPIIYGQHNNNVQAQLHGGDWVATGIPFVQGTNTLSSVIQDLCGRTVSITSTVIVANRSYTYALNGNLTNDSRFAYTWDYDNRLIAVRDAKTGALIQENRYDALGRRREKIEHREDGNTTNRYLYRGWLVLAVTDGSGIVLETFTHGLDLSGRVGGSAGGIAGLLTSTQADNSAYYHYDFNGNILNASGAHQSQLAKYTYSPFGNVLLKEGSFDSRYQFSTKEYDLSTGLNYYGYRFYNSFIGRWIYRDIICETGGLNLYNSIGNNPINNCDVVGLITYYDAILHWLQGEGRSYGISFDEADPNASANDFEGFDKKVQDACETHEDQEVDLIQNFDLGTNHPIGRHNYRLEGTITFIEEECDWDFTGTISSASGIDPFDFDRSWFDGDANNNRGFFAEMSTWGGAVLGLVLFADDFDFVIFGDKEITDKGSCD